MKTVFVSAVLPYPLHSGGQVRIYNLLKRLSKRHDISLFAFIRSDEEKKYINELSFCKKVVPVHRGRAWQASYVTRSLVSSYPFLMETYHNAQMGRLLADEVINCDLVHIEPGYVWPSIPRSTVPVVVAEHNVEHTVYEGFVRQFPVAPLRPFMRLDVSKLKYWEKKIWSEASRIVAVSPEDRSEIEAISGRSDVAVVPNGVDLNEFPFKPKKHTKKLTFLYVGNFKWMENKDAADNIVKNYWPVIVKSYPNARLRIVGPGAPDGPVARIQDELYGADILLAPLRIGGGTKFKILEAMATGVPIITTTIGAQGLAADCLWVADSPPQLRIADVLKDTKKVGKARALIEKKYNWDSIAIKLENIWKTYARK